MTDKNKDGTYIGAWVSKTLLRLLLHLI